MKRIERGFKSCSTMTLDETASRKTGEGQKEKTSKGGSLLKRLKRKLVGNYGFNLEASQYPDSTL